MSKSKRAWVAVGRRAGARASKAELMNIFKCGGFGGAARSFPRMAATVSALGALLLVIACSSNELGASDAAGAGGMAAQAPASEPGSPAGQTGATQPAELDESVRAFAARTQAQ